MSSPCKKDVVDKIYGTKLDKVTCWEQNICSENYEEEPRQVLEEQMI